MKIGILTFHSVHNFGAVLQAYGLQEFLCSLEHDAYIIDYRPPYLTERYKTISFKRAFKNGGRVGLKFLLRELFTYPILRRRKRYFNKFVNDALKLVPLENLKEQNDFDAFVFGSDQIWNPLICNGLDPMYLGDFVAAKGKRLISYAGSMGSLKHFNTEQLELLVKKLSPFYAISSREKGPADFLAKKLNKVVETVVDPVLLAGKDVFDRIATRIVTHEQYLLLFTLGHNDKTLSIANRIAQIKNLKIVEIVSFQTSLKKRSAMQALSVYDFLGYIRSAEFVVTSSFHGTALSVLFGKELYYVPDDSITGERAANLLQMLGIGDRVWTEMCDNNDVSMIDYEMVFRILDMERKKSISFIKSALEFK